MKTHTQFDPNLNKNVSLLEVEKFVNKLKRNKAVGIDNIPNEVLKQACLFPGSE